MLNPDRAEFGSQPELASENARRNGHLPRWARVPAFALRTSLAILTTSPGMAIAADAIHHRENPSIVYDSGQKPTVDPQYDFDQPSPLVTPTPTPTETPQSPMVHKVKTLICSELCSPLSGTKTGINLKAEQTAEISATGRLFLRSGFGYNSGSSCETAYEFDPDGNRYYQRKFFTFNFNEVCPPFPAGQNELPWVSLIGNVKKDFASVGSQKIFIGSHWKGSFDRDGELWLGVNSDVNNPFRGGYDITVTVYPTAEKKTEVVAIPTPQPSVTSITSTEKGPDLAGWLGGLGVALFAGLASYKFYERWKLRKGSGAGVTTGSSVGATPRIGGIAGALPDPSNPNTAPSTGPTQPKNPEWIVGQQEFKKKWQDAKSKLSPLRAGDNGNEHGYILERFKAGMNIMHEVSLDDAIKVPTMAIRVRAGIEYLIPEIWSNNRIFKRFFDPGFNAGLLTNEALAKILYLPEQYRSLSNFTEVHRKDVRRIHRILIHALHPDTSTTDANPKLKESIDDLLKKFNPAWTYIDRLIK